MLGNHPSGLSETPLTSNGYLSQARSAQGLIGVAPSTDLTPMFSSSLRASLVVLLASALVVSAAPAVSDVPSVTVKTSTTNVNVDGLQNLKVTTTIVNTGGETLKLLKDPRGALNSFPENTFTITGPTGFQPSFNGARVNRRSGYLLKYPRTNTFSFRLQVKYSPKYAAGLDDDSVFVVLSPGGSVDVVHDRKWDHLDHL